MNLEHITYSGPEFDGESKIINLLPDNLVALLKQINGFIQYEGGLHVRGICHTPEWHSIETVLNGSSALYKMFPSVEETDIPFAEDCVGDQFLIRNRKIVKLSSETGEIVEFGLGLVEFLETASNQPVDFLSMEPLIQLQNEGGKLDPGQLIHVYPPFCTKEAKNGVSLKTVSSLEALKYLSNFSSQITGLKEGEKFEVKLVD